MATSPLKLANSLSSSWRSLARHVGSYSGTDRVLGCPWKRTLHKLEFEIASTKAENFVTRSQAQPPLILGGGKLFDLQLELLCLQPSFFAYNPLRCLLEALSHCKQESSNCKLNKTPIVSREAPRDRAIQWTAGLWKLKRFLSSSLPEN